jgi:hypothetical protein
VRARVRSRARACLVHVHVCVYLRVYVCCTHTYVHTGEHTRDTHICTCWHRCELRGRPIPAHWIGVGKGAVAHACPRRRREWARAAGHKAHADRWPPVRRGSSRRLHKQVQGACSSRTRARKTRATTSLAPTACPVLRACPRQSSCWKHKQRGGVQGPQRRARRSRHTRRRQLDYFGHPLGGQAGEDRSQEHQSPHVGFCSLFSFGGKI